MHNYERMEGAQELMVSIASCELNAFYKLKRSDASRASLCRDVVNPMLELFS